MSCGFIFIPGAGMSDWAWSKTTPLLILESVSIPRRIKNNTYHNRLNSSFSDILEYANNIINRSGFNEVILVAHSGAGLIAGSLCKINSKIKHVVFIAANIPKHDTTAIDIFSSEIQEKNIEAIKKQAVNDTIPMKMLQQQFRLFFCNTCNEEDISYILQQDYIPEPICLVTQKMDWSDFPDIRKTYIVCTEDKTLSENQQELLAGNLNIIDIRKIASDHMVMISHPNELAFELNSIVKYLK